MTNTQLLEQIKKSLNSGEITVHDLQALAGTNLNSIGNGNAPIQNTAEKAASTQKIVTRVLYGIGSLIAVIGVVVLLMDNWDVLGSFGRLISTLGIAIGTYALAMFAFKKNQSGLTQSYFAISAAIMPIGLFVLFNEIGVSDLINGAALNSWVIGICLIIFASALWATKKSVLHIACGIYSAWFVYAVLANLVRGSDLSFSLIKDIYVYGSMVLALGYLSYGSWVKTRLNEIWVSKLYTLVAFALFLGSALFLTGIWNLLYAFIAVGAVSLSIQMRTTPGLIVSALAIAVYIVKISAEYFADSIGWALLLVFVGFLIIGLGYATYYLNKKYIHEEERNQR